MKNKLLICLIISLFAAVPLFAQDEAVVDSIVVPDTTMAPAPAPVTNLTSNNTENDHGHSITLNWTKSSDDGAGNNSVMQYEIFRWVPFFRDSVEVVRIELETASAALRSLDSPDNAKDVRDEVRDRYEALLARYADAYAQYPENGEWQYEDKTPSGAESFDHRGSKNRIAKDYMPDFCGFYYRVESVSANSLVRSSSGATGPVESSGEYYNTGRTPVLIAVLLFGLLTLIYVAQAKKGKDLYVRPLAGIEAVDDAIGRATEMGRPILYVLGLGTASDVATIASFTILSRVSKRVAEYQTEVIVPTYDPIVMSVAQEVVKSAYFDAGRPDDYKDDTVYFVTQSQFAYVAAVNGTMLRELPATNIYMGKFFAESLLLAETGAVAGSIQIAGTDEIAQIPFFIVACDYTLIGEELYAASAYLGREPVLLGSLKAQDYAKAVVIIISIIGLVAANMEWTGFTELFRVTN